MQLAGRWSRVASRCIEFEIRARWIRDIAHVTDKSIATSFVRFDSRPSFRPCCPSVMVRTRGFNHQSLTGVRNQPGGRNARFFEDKCPKIASCTVGVVIVQQRRTRDFSHLRAHAPGPENQGQNNAKQPNQEPLSPKSTRQRTLSTTTQNQQNHGRSRVRPLRRD